MKIGETKSQGSPVNNSYDRAVAAVAFDFAQDAFRLERVAEAEDLVKRAIDINRRGLRKDPVINNYSLLGAIELQRNRPKQAYDLLKEAISLTAEPFSAISDNQLRILVSRLVQAAFQLSGDKEAEAVALRATQLTAQSTVADALSRMATRFAVGNDDFARTLRQHQDLGVERAEVRRVATLMLAAKLDAPDQSELQKLLRRHDALGEQISRIETELNARYPKVNSFVSQTPLTIAEIQASLAGDEALLLFVDTPEATFVWVVTKSDARWVRNEIGTEALTEAAAALRCGLDGRLWDNATDWQKARRARCKTLVGAEPRIETVGGIPVGVQSLPFDTARSSRLYKALFGQTEDLVRGKLLLVVPPRPLSGLPFNVLVTEPPAMGIPPRFADYRKVAWLGTQMPITVLPSVSSLTALRSYAKASRATRPWLGIGNPLLDGPDLFSAQRAQEARDRQKCLKWPMKAATMPSIDRDPVKSFLALFRRGHVDIEQVRQWKPLPETADELCEVGPRLGALESDILLGAHATEDAVKSLSDSGRLADYRIVHFATHGALSGEVQGSAEPGLILTPPAKGTTDPQELERDDGFLTASEIATLKLDANWVVLSACNTAAGTSDSAEALSGVARAFFYGGARALLVSHWEVGSRAAVALMTRSFAELDVRPEIGRSEALRMSMRELVEKGAPWQAHPSQWAPFVVVGENGAR